MNYEKSKGKIRIKHRTPIIVGECQCCKNVIFDDVLFVDLENSMYHFSCHNRKVQKENESKNE